MDIAKRIFAPAWPITRVVLMQERGDYCLKKCYITKESSFWAQYRRKVIYNGYKQGRLHATFIDKTHAQTWIDNVETD